MFAVRGGSSVLLRPDIPALEIKLGALVVLLFGLTPLGMVEGCCLGPGVCWVCCPTTCRASTPPSAPLGSGYDEPGPSVHNSSLQVCCVRHQVTPPLGIGVGMGLMETKGSPQHQLTGSMLQGMATRTFIYITVLEVLSQELHSVVKRIPRVAPMLLFITDQRHLEVLQPTTRGQLTTCECGSRTETFG